MRDGDGDGAGRDRTGRVTRGVISEEMGVGVRIREGFKFRQSPPSERGPNGLQTNSQHRPDGQCGINQIAGQVTRSHWDCATLNTGPTWRQTTRRDFGVGSRPERPRRQTGDESGGGPGPTSLSNWARANKYNEGTARGTAGMPQNNQRMVGGRGAERPEEEKRERRAHDFSQGSNSTSDNWPLDAR